MRPRLIPPTVVAAVLLATGSMAALASTASPSTSTTSTTLDTTPDTTADTTPGAPAEPTPLRAADLDPQHYIDQYPQVMEDEQTSGAPAPAAPGGPLVKNATVDASRVPPGPAPSPAPSQMPVPGPGDDNTFVDHGDSGWVSTSTDAESTFGLDVDTGSFRVVQSMLDQSVCPEPGAVRVEEWVNAFNYGDPDPVSGDVALSVQGGPAWHATDGTRLVRVGVSTRNLTAAERPKAHITFVIDTSGSMDIRDRLGTVQASLALLVQHLNDGDTLAVVEYGSEARVLLHPTPVEDTQRIIDVIDNLRSDGSTNMEAGLQLGYGLAQETFDPEALNVVVLASDGVANVGTTDADVLTQQITRAGDQGIHLVTVGYGMGNYNDHLMEQLADMGDGFYSYVDTLDEARRLFVTDLTPTLTVVASDAKAQARFDASVVSQYRLVGYENRALDDSQFDDADVDAGELGAGHRVSALYEVRLQPGVAPTAALGTVLLRWKDHAGTTQELSMPLTAGDDELPETTRLAALVAATAEVMRGSATAAERGITLDTLLAEATALRAQNVNGATDLVTLITSALPLADCRAAVDDDHDST